MFSFINILDSFQIKIIYFCLIIFYLSPKYVSLLKCHIEEVEGHLHVG